MNLKDPEKRLAIDESWVQRMEGVWRSLHHPEKHSDNPLVRPDRAWEGYLVLQPGTVIYDTHEQWFKMWYNTHPNLRNPDVEEFLCYATSADGIRWEKPDLNLVEYKGSKANNICLKGVNWTHCVICDEADPDPQRRYKLAYWSRSEGGDSGIYVAFSPDGIRWANQENNPVVPNWASGDTFSVMRNPMTEQYLLYHKTPGGPIRKVSRMVSDDFIHWRDSRQVLMPDAHDPPDTQFYGLSAFPYAGLYVGFLWVYHTYSQKIDLQLVSSHDGLHWDRTCGRKLFMHLVPTNHYSGKSFDSEMIYPASAPVVQEGQLWIYYSGFSVPHNAPGRDHDGQIGLARMRLDGFCSLDATSRGVVLTRPFTVRGSRLSLNAQVGGPDAGEADLVWNGVFTGCAGGRGNIRVEAQDENGAPIPGYSAADCVPFTGNGTDETIAWEGEQDLSSLLGRTVQLKFVLGHARLFAWQIGGHPEIP